MTYKIIIQLIKKYLRNTRPSLINHVLYRLYDLFHIEYSKNKMCTDLDSFLKSVFVRAGKHTSVHGVHPHNYRAFESLRERSIHLRYMNLLISLVSKISPYELFFKTLGIFGFFRGGS